MTGWQVNHYHFHIALAAIAEKKEITQDTELQINSHKITQNPITEILISNHRVEMVHHTQDQILKIIHNIIADHNHLTITETEIVHDGRSHEIDFIMLEIMLILRQITNKQTTLRRTLRTKIFRIKSGYIRWIFYLPRRM